MEHGVGEGVDGDDLILGVVDEVVDVVRADESGTARDEETYTVSNRIRTYLRFYPLQGAGNRCSELDPAASGWYE